MKYSVLFLDYFADDRHVGVLEKSDPNVGSGEVGHQHRGDCLIIQIQIGSAHTIEDAKFKAHGSASIIACCAYTAAWLIGKSLSVAKKLNADEIAQKLNLSPAKINAAIAVVDALLAAVADVERKIALNCK